MAKAKQPSQGKIGRPSLYTEQLADEICEAIASGSALRVAVQDHPHWPEERTIYRWLEAHESFRQQYARARERQADAEFDEIRSIADETPELEPVLDKDGQVVEMRMSSAYVAWQKSRIDARKWRAAKMRPKVYGDKVQTEVSGPDGKPIEVAAPREVAQKAAFLLAKGLKAKA